MKISKFVTKKILYIVKKHRNLNVNNSNLGQIFNFLIVELDIFFIDQFQKDTHFLSCLDSVLFNIPQSSESQKFFFIKNDVMMSCQSLKNSE